MERQLGHVKYKGTIGEIRHFKIKGMTYNQYDVTPLPTKKSYKSHIDTLRINLSFVWLFGRFFC